MLGSDQCMGTECSYSFIKKITDPTSNKFSCISCSDISAEDDRYQPFFNDRKGYCDEVCGDGKNMGLVECDDGNRVNQDGCSSDCKIERNYRCSGGSPD